MITVFAGLIRQPDTPHVLCPECESYNRYLLHVDLAPDGGVRVFCRLHGTSAEWRSQTPRATFTPDDARVLKELGEALAELGDDRQRVETAQRTLTQSESYVKLTEHRIAELEQRLFAEKTSA